MISRAHRFHGHKGLRYVYQNGSVTRGPLFILKYIENPHRHNYRLAVVVSRKVEKSAVGRNRMRRRLYEAVRANEKQITRPFDIVLTVFSNDLLNQPAGELSKQVHKQLRSAGIIAANPKS